MGPVIWNILSSFSKRAGSLDGFKNLYKKLLRNWPRFLLDIVAILSVHYFMLSAGEKYNFYNQDKHIDKINK